MRRYVNLEAATSCKRDNAMIKEVMENIKQEYCPFGPPNEYWDIEKMWKCASEDRRKELYILYGLDQTVKNYLIEGDYEIEAYPIKYGERVMGISLHHLTCAENIDCPEDDGYPSHMFYEIEAESQFF